MNYILNRNIAKTTKEVNGSCNPENKCSYCGSNLRCNNCNKRNHFERCCTQKNVDEVNEDVDSQQIEEVAKQPLGAYVIVPMSALNVASEDRCTTKEVICLNGTKVRVKLDTSAEVNIMPKRVFDQLKQNPLLRPTSTKLQGYDGFDIPARGECTIQCTTDKNEISEMNFYVVESNSRTVIGLSSCERLGFVKTMNRVGAEQHMESKLERIRGKKGNELKKEILAMYPEVFRGLGRIEPPHKMQLIPNYCPTVQPPRKIPETIRLKLKVELDHMEKDGVIAKVDEPSEWVSSLVIVEKPDGTLRVCLDPRDLNKYLKREHYQLPTLEEISTRLSGATLFTKLDANKGYWQIPLDYESSLLTTFNTPFGRYRFLRLPFGVHTAQQVFHKWVNQRFGDILNVETDIDDFLIFGYDDENHHYNLIVCLDRVQANNITLNINKCSFGVEEVTYLDHRITKDGVFPDGRKVKAIKEMPTPTSKKDVQRFLGLVNYVGGFIPNLSEVNEPMRNLLKKEVEFEWSSRQQKSFDQLKDVIVSDKCLAVYDVQKDVFIKVDACKTGLGAVLFQDGRPVAYASRSLTPAQLNYAVIEKEMQAVVFACERFHQYIYGKLATVYSDHKPLESISTKAISKAPARLQRMLLRLQKYMIKIIYKPGVQMTIPDALSRAHLPEQNEEIPEEEMKSQIHMVMSNCLPKDQLETVKEESMKDEVLVELKEYILDGWPGMKNVSPEAKRYYVHREDLTNVDGVLFKGERVIIPSSMRAQLVSDLHSSHMGIEETKQRSRNSVFWPGINRQIEDVCNACNACIYMQKKLQKEPLMPYDVPIFPMQVAGTNLLHWEGQDFVIVVDYYSRYWEVERLQNLSSALVINKMKAIFARMGIPEILRSDNGPHYNSPVFKEFTEAWHIKHITNSPEYQKSNGMVEKHVQVFKNILTTCKLANSDPFLAILEWRNTPVDNYKSPDELMKGHLCRSIVPQKNSKYNVQSCDQTYNGKLWEKGETVAKCEEPMSYLGKNEKGNIVRDIVTKPRKHNEENKNTEDMERFDEEIHEEIVATVAQSRYGRVIRTPEQNTLHNQKVEVEYKLRVIEQVRVRVEASTEKC